MKKTILFATLAIAGVLATATVATAQIAGSTTTVGVSVTETERLALGWSVKKSVLGKTIYNDAGAKIGKVQDLIVDPERSVSYVIIGAGGFLGIAQHDVAVPIAQVREQDGKLVMPGATKDALKALAPFHYANGNAGRDRFVADAHRDIASAKRDMATLDKKASAAAGDVKQKLDQQNAAMRVELREAEDKLAEMNRAGAGHWKEFEGDVSAALARLKKSVGTATG
ncbi:photosystem reaction center protein H [Variovorax sp. PAMC 28711]|nr:PRC-barrel domain-containing protein [Variovorax sp. PAMC 28711]AMM23530.1 photosystem reaction center protein H [Variovorax sp. PAMC 28711]